MPGRRAPALPLEQRAARPEPDRLADDGVRHPVGHRIAPARGARLEHRPRHVPLEEVDDAARVGRQVRELVDQETLAGAGQAGHEHDPRRAREPLELPRERSIGGHDEVRRGVAAGWRVRLAQVPTRSVAERSRSSAIVDR